MNSRHAWFPSDDFLERSNVARFMRKHGISTHAELIRRSIVENEWFWDAVVEDLDIRFFQRYEKVVDLSEGPAWAKWFVGGTINVAYNCVDKHAASFRREKPAVVWEGEDGERRTWTYADLARETNRLANALSRRGVGLGDRVGIALPMLPETVSAFFACAKIGAISVPIFSGYGAEAIADRLNDCSAKVLIAADKFLRKGKWISLGLVAERAIRSCPTITDWIVVERVQNDRSIGSERARRLSEIVETMSDERDCERLDAETPLFIGYTSGTTGKPKGAVHVHAGFLVKIAQEVAHQVDLRESDRLFWLTDLGWIMGPWELVGGLANGGTIVLYEGAADHPSSDRLWAAVDRLGVTILGLSPTLIRSLKRYGDGPVSAHDLSRLRVLGSTGEPWNDEPWRWYFERVGGGRCPVINFSGGTEIGASLLSPLPIEPIKPCSLGGPALGMATNVYGPNGEALRGDVGELVCEKPWPAMTRGLWNDSERYISAYWSRWPKVWTHGDWASIDEDGCWFLHGRSDDTIKVAGKRIGPAEIESSLVRHPDVLEAAAIGVPHELKGETVRCFVVLKPERTASERLKDELKTRVVDSLGKSFAPESIDFVSELPKTRSAKVLRRAIRARVLGEEPGDLSSLDNPSALEQFG